MATDSLKGTVSPVNVGDEPEREMWRDLNKQALPVPIPRRASPEPYKPGLYSSEHTGAAVFGIPASVHLPCHLLRLLIRKDAIAPFTGDLPSQSSVFLHCSLEAGLTHGTDKQVPRSYSELWAVHRI